jgi:alpha-beta hydrolase superfamily lysophospholipase/SAM-dependent methyltransferase
MIALAQPRELTTHPAMNPAPMRAAAEERTFRTHDGVALFYRHWPEATPHRTGAVVLIHRGHEHSGRMAHLVRELAMPGFAFFAFDARGHGRSPGARGDSPGIEHSVRDIQSFIDHIAHEHDIAVEEIAVVAQSVGAVLAAAWVHDYAPPIRALVLAAAAFKIKLYVPFAQKGLALMRRFRGNFFVSSYVKGRYLTHDPERIPSFEADPLITKAISVDMLLGLSETAARIIADAQAIVVPTQLLISGADFVVHEGPQHDFFGRLGAAVKERHVLDGFFHDTLGERDRAEAIDLMREFLRRRFRRSRLLPNLRNADRESFSKREADALAKPLSAFSPRRITWALHRTALAIAGRLSRGVALGHEAGFDSGSMLDYVYRNVPQGRGILGRALDRAYLNSIGWRGIRRRKQHLEELIAAAADGLRAARLPLRIVDIAAGHGRYALDAIAQNGLAPDSVLLRDFSERNVAAGRDLIAERRLEGIVRFKQGDAFDPDSLAALSPKPTLAIVSGLYELFPDNAMILRSLEGLAAAMPAGACLVYTNQPWHPQLEYIARVLTSHRAGQPWVMRRRSQAEMDQLVTAAGFRKVEQRIDPWGIFTVGLAVKITP